MPASNDCIHRDGPRVSEPLRRQIAGHDELTDTLPDDTPRMLDASASDTRSDGMSSNLLDFSNRFNPIDGRDYLVSRKGRSAVAGVVDFA